MTVGGGEVCAVITYLDTRETGYLDKGFYPDYTNGNPVFEKIRI